MSTKTAILFFSRTAAAETSAKSIVAASKNLQVIKTLIQHTRQTALQTGLPIIEAGQQEGNSFGERLDNAIQSAWKSGFDQLIIIGNDSPQLDAQTILEAQEQLQHQDFVIGPSLDGGAYLIGIHQKNYDKKAFLQLDWQTTNFLNSLTSYIEQSNWSNKTLSPLQDIDNEIAFKKLLQTLKTSHTFLYQLLIAILIVPQLTLFVSQLNKKAEKFAQALLRAPPTGI